MTLVIGLTGSIAMGKSTTAAMFRRLRIPVHDADREVHDLMRPGGPIVAKIAAMFPGTVGVEGVDRVALGARVFGDPDALRRLEAIVHPQVSARTRRFLAGCRRRRASLAVLDVPLLLERTGHRRCDVVAVVSAPRFLQHLRILARPGMTGERLEAILAQQMPDPEKRRRADIVLPTGLGRAVTMRHLRRWVVGLRRGASRRCGKSCWIRRRRAWTPNRETASSNSAASS